MINLVAVRGQLANVIAETSTTLPLSAGILPGNILIARIAADNSGAGGIAPALTIPGWFVAGRVQDPGAANAGTAVFLAVTRTDTVPTSMQLNWSPAVAAKAVVVEEWSGIDRTNSRDGLPAVASGAGTFAAVGVTVTANNADQVVYCALAAEGPSADAYTEDADTTRGAWQSLSRLGTTNATATNNQKIVGAWKRVTAAGVQSWNATITSRDWAAVALVLNPSTLATTPSCPPDVWSPIYTADQPRRVYIDNRAGLAHVYVQRPAAGYDTKVPMGIIGAFDVSSSEALAAMPCETVPVTVET